jgi:hypothetical protein
MTMMDKKKMTMNLNKFFSQKKCTSTSTFKNQLLQNLLPCCSRKRTYSNKWMLQYAIFICNGKNARSESKKKSTIGESANVDKLEQLFFRLSRATMIVVRLCFFSSKWKPH